MKNQVYSAKKGANPGQMFRALALISRVQRSLSLALLGLSSPCTYMYVEKYTTPFSEINKMYYTCTCGIGDIMLVEILTLIGEFCIRSLLYS